MHIIVVRVIQPAGCQLLSDIAINVNDVQHITNTIAVINSIVKMIFIIVFIVIMYLCYLLSVL